MKRMLRLLSLAFFMVILTFPGVSRDCPQIDTVRMAHWPRVAATISEHPVDVVAKHDQTAHFN